MFEDNIAGGILWLPTWVLREKFLPYTAPKLRREQYLLPESVGTPWTLPSDAVTDELSMSIRVDVALVVDAGQLPATPRAPDEGGLTRRVHLRRCRELEEYGFADYCKER